jgi:hypothetical protein
LRTTYRPKKDSHGEDRHMGPHPHLIKAARDQIEASMPKDQVSEKVVNGKLMEIKGLQLQHGISNSMAVNMTYAQYMKRMGFKEESNKKPRSPSPAPKRAPSKPTPEQLETKMLEAAAGYLKKEGLDNLDAQKFETAVRDAVRGDGCPVLRMGICGDVSPCIGVGEGGRTQEEKGSIGGKLSSLWSSMASLREKMRFGGRDGHTSQDTTKDPLAASFEDTSLLNSHGIPNGRDAGATFEGVTRIQRKVKFQNQALEVDNAKEFNLTLHERWLEMQQFLVRWYWPQFSAS